MPTQATPIPADMNPSIIAAYVLQSQFAAYFNIRLHSDQAFIGWVNSQTINCLE